jgi:DNA mismatch endonuclease (patch repair protein)
MAVASMLRAAKINGWRRHRRLRIGPLKLIQRLSAGVVDYARIVRPDFFFARNRVSVFVDGCFWHDCPQRRSRPTANAKFWREKFEMNARRDEVVAVALRRHGWTVVRLWEHDVKHKPSRCIA